MGILNNIVDRCNVYESDFAVCRKVYLSFSPTAKRDKGLKEARKAMYRGAITIHKQNKELYSKVVKGNL